MKTIALALIALGLAACSTATHLPTDDTRAGEMVGVPPQSVTILYGVEAIKGYKPIGVVLSAVDGSSGEEAVMKLKEEAAKMGATAIADLRLEIEYGFWDSAVKASGLAVRK